MTIAAIALVSLLSVGSAGDPATTVSASVSAPAIDPARAKAVRASLITALESWSRAAEGHRIRVRTKVFSGFGTATIGTGDALPARYEPDPAARVHDVVPLREHGPFYVKTTELVVSRNAAGWFRVDERTTAADPVLRGQLGVRTVYTRDDSGARSVARTMRDDDSLAETLIIDETPRDILKNIGFSTTALGWGVDGFEANTPARILRDLAVAGPIELDDGTWMWRCRMPNQSNGTDEPDAGMHRELDVIVDPADPTRPRALQFVVSFVPGAGIAPDADQPPALTGHGWRQLITFPDGFLRVGDHWIPRTTRLEAEIRDRDGSGDGWAVYDVTVVGTPERIDLKQLDAAYFRESVITPNATVVDTRLGIGFDLGTERITVNGRLLTTHRPVDLTVLDDLDAWIEAGTFNDGRGRDD